MLNNFVINKNKFSLITLAFSFNKYGEKIPVKIPDIQAVLFEIICGKLSPHRILRGVLAIILSIFSKLLS